MRQLGVVGLGLLLAACNARGREAPVVVAAVQAPGAPAPLVLVSGVIAGPLGATLDEADRRTAFDAQVAAVSSGEKRSWRGGHGTFGFVEPGALRGSCRDYTASVFIDGRPQSAKGSACQQADSSWQMTS